jgi:hypothetical protein
MGAPERQPRIGGLGQRQAALAIEQHHFAAPEVHRAAEARALEARGAVHPGPGRDVAGLALEHGLCVQQRLAALPALDHAWVAGVGHRACTEVGGDEGGVGVDPGEGRLGLGQVEAAADEGPVDDIELAQDLCVGPAARQADHAAPVLRAQAVRSAPHPVLAFRARQGIQVEHRLPARLRLAVLVEGGAAQQAAGVGRVLPEVVEPGTSPHHRGDARARVEDRAQRIARAGEIRPGLEPLTGRAVALAGPRKRALSLHVLQPEPGVFRRRRHGG